MKIGLININRLTSERRSRIISLSQQLLLNLILLAAFVYSARVIIMSGQSVGQIIENNGMVSIDLGSIK